MSPSGSTGTDFFRLTLFNFRVFIFRLQLCHQLASSTCSKLNSSTKSPTLWPIPLLLKMKTLKHSRHTLAYCNQHRFDYFSQSCEKEPWEYEAWRNKTFENTCFVSKTSPSYISVYLSNILSTTSLTWLRTNTPYSTHVLRWICFTTKKIRLNLKARSFFPQKTSAFCASPESIKIKPF